MDPRRKNSRDCELALAFVRSSSAVQRALPILRKCAALVNRSDGSGVIVQRILGTDPKVGSHLRWIFSSMSIPDAVKEPPTMPEAIELFGWEIAREVALVVLLHELHAEICAPLSVRPETLDRRALGVLTASAELKAGGIAALFANVGEAELLRHPSSLQVSRSVYEEGTNRTVAEKAAFGFDHAILGSYMLSEVDFPASICDEVFQHADFGSQIWVAEQLADDVLGPNGANVGSESAIWKSLKMSASRTDRLKKNIWASGELPHLAFADALSRVA